MTTTTTPATDEEIAEWDHIIGHINWYNALRARLDLEIETKKYWQQSEALMAERLEQCMQMWSDEVARRKSAEAVMDNAQQHWPTAQYVLHRRAYPKE